MHYQSLVAFLSGTLTPEALADELASEVAAFYADLRSKAQGLIDISDGPRFVVTKAAARQLLGAVAARRLPNETAVYVADCIVASGRMEFADDAVREVISLIEDDSRRFVEGDGELWTQQELSAAFARLD